VAPPRNGQQIGIHDARRYETLDARRQVLAMEPEPISHE
jgi:hypothetical protein